jgi:hypothetical protein
MEIRRNWADKIITYLNTEVNWKYENHFKFKADITRISNDKVNGSLDEFLLDEDISGIIGTYVFNDIEIVKRNLEKMKSIFGNEENLENGKNILLAHWNNWDVEE